MIIMVWGDICVSEIYIEKKTFCIDFKAIVK